MSPYDLATCLDYSINVLSLMLYAMLTVQVVSARRHWFVKAAILGIAVAAFVVLPSYELAVQYGAAVTTFAIALTVWRRKRERLNSVENTGPKQSSCPRVALRDVFLFTIVVAATLNLCVHTPTYSAYQWPFTLVDAAVIAAVGMSCVWLVFGRARWGFRVAAAPLVVVFGVVAFRVWWAWFSFGIDYNFNRYTATLERFYQEQWMRFWRVLWPRFFEAETVAIAIGIVVFICWLLLFRAANWFPELHATRMPPSSRDGNWSHRRSVLKWLPTAAAITLGALPIYVWARLVTPHSLPPEAFATDQNYRDLVDVAAELFKANGGEAGFMAWQGSDAQIAKLVARDEPQWRRVRTVIERGCQFPWQLPDTIVDNKSMVFLSTLTSFRAARGDGTGAIEPRLAACLDAIRLGAMEDRTSSNFFGGFNRAASVAQNELWNLRSSLSAQQCKDTARELAQIDGPREPWESFNSRSRQILQNSSWKLHIHLVIKDICGLEDHSQYNHLPLFMRMLIIGFAIRAYELDRGQLPESLDQLVPEYLDAMLDDPYGNGPPKYKRDGDGYVLYSVWINGADDGGVYRAGSEGDLLGDVTTKQMFQSPRRPTPASTPPAAATEEKKDAAGAVEKIR